MRVLLTPILLFYCFSNAKAQISFYGQLDTSVLKNQISHIQLFRPIANTTQQIYADSLDDIQLNKDRQFTRKVIAIDSGLYYLGMPNGQKFRIVAIPGDTICFTLNASNNSFGLEFTGKRAFANEFINTIRNKVVAAVNQIYQDKSEPQVFWSKIDSFINATQTYVRQRENDKYRVSFLSKTVDMELLHAIINLYGNATDKNPEAARYRAISERAYQKFNPLQANYLPVSPVSLLNVSKLGYHLNEKKTQFAASQFSVADSNWAKINEGFMIPSTLPEPFRETLIGSYVLLDLLVLKSEHANLAIGYFLYQYPKSDYTNIFLKILLNREPPGEIEHSSKEPVSVKLLFNTDLNNVLKKYAPNQRVLIDCWATWCIYCVAEFPYYPKSEHYFRDNNIVKVFISYDNVKNQKDIEKVIIKNKLTGIHLVVDTELKKQISQLISFPSDQILPLPRYILLDERHRVIDPDLIRPSNPNFESYISKKLKSAGKQ